MESPTQAIFMILAAGLSSATAGRMGRTNARTATRKDDNKVLISFPFSRNRRFSTTFGFLYNQDQQVFTSPKARSVREKNIMSERATRHRRFFAGVFAVALAATPLHADTPVTTIVRTNDPIP